MRRSLSSLARAARLWRVLLLNRSRLNVLRFIDDSVLFRRSWLEF
jgi:hypothetical protein